MTLAPTVLKAVGGFQWVTVSAVLPAVTGVLVVRARRSGGGPGNGSAASAARNAVTSVGPTAPSVATGGPAGVVPVVSDVAGRPRWVRVAVAAACFVAVAAIVGLVDWNRLRVRPSVAEVAASVAKTPAPPPVRVVAVDLAVVDASPSRCRVTYRGMVETSEPVFRRSDTSEYLHAQRPVGVSAIEAAAVLRRGPEGDRIRAFLASSAPGARGAGSDGTPTVAPAPQGARGPTVAPAAEVAAPSAAATVTPCAVTPSVRVAVPPTAEGDRRAAPEHFQGVPVAELMNIGAGGGARWDDVVLVTTETPPGTLAPCSGVLTAWRHGGAWVWSSDAIEIDRRRLRGDPKPIGARVFAVDPPDDASRLRSWLDAAVADVAKVRSAAETRAPGRWLRTQRRRRSPCMCDPTGMRSRATARAADAGGDRGRGEAQS